VISKNAANQAGQEYASQVNVERHTAIFKIEYEDSAANSNRPL
jgi:hypothetical protein